jgi:hypothetical protein
MALQWGTTDQVGLNGVKVLVYGGPGAGKTRLIATAPRPVIGSAESGLLSLRQHKIPFALIKTYQDLLEFYQWCAYNAVRNGILTVGLDSVSEIAEQILANEKARVKDPRQAYGELIERVLHVVRLFRDLPGLNVYISAKMEFTKDEMGRMFYQPSLPGSKLGPALPYFFDEVFHLGLITGQDGKNYEALLTTTTPQHNSPKDRSGALAAYEAPNLQHIFNKILGVIQ